MNTESVLSEHVRLGADGRLVLPSALRKSVGLNPGDTVVIESDGDSLLVRSYEAVIRETQQFFAQFPAPGGSVVDELITDRRADAARELAAERTGGA